MKKAYPTPDTAKFSLEQRVWSALSDEDEGIVTGILFRPSGVLYRVTWGDRCETEHYECEIVALKEEARHIV